MSFEPLPRYWLSKRQGKRPRVLHIRKTCVRFPADEVTGIMAVRDVEGGNNVRVCKRCLGGGQGAKPAAPPAVVPEIHESNLARLRQREGAAIFVATLAAASMWLAIGWPWEGAATVVLAVVLCRRLFAHG